MNFESVIKYLTNPVTSKILLEIELHKEITAKQLNKKYSDIPQATLYRYLKRMCNDEVIKVIYENKVRGTYEKVYSLAPGYTNNLTDVLDGDYGAPYLKFFMQFAKGLIKEFQDYAAKDSEKKNGDGSGFFINPIYATDEELLTFHKQIMQIFEELENNAHTPERKLRNAAFIITPPR